MMKFEDEPYYMGGKNRVDEMWACMNNEVVLNDKKFNNKELIFKFHHCRRLQTDNQKLVVIKYFGQRML